MTGMRAGRVLSAVVMAAALVAASVSPAGAAARHRWMPAPDTQWQWELSNPLTVREIHEHVSFFDIDGFENSAATVARIHRAGKHAICYIDVGTWENWRPDAHKFPKSVLGRPDSGWPGERWLDIRRRAVIEPLMAARFRMCARKHFDAVEPDNIDGYQNDTGFPITAHDQLVYDIWIAREVHSLGMSVAQKNDPEQTPVLVHDYDFALDEQCLDYSECSYLEPYVHRHRAVLEVEYTTHLGFCRRLPAGFTGMAKHLSLGNWRRPCPGTRAGA